VAEIEEILEILMKRTAVVSKFAMLASLCAVLVMAPPSSASAQTFNVRYLVVAGGGSGGGGAGGARTVATASFPVNFGTAFPVTVGSRHRDRKSLSLGTASGKWKVLHEVFYFPDTPPSPRR
jgi:hypothetical protein